RGGPRRALPALPAGGARARPARGQARQVRQVHRLQQLPGVQVHPEPERTGASRARAARGNLPRVRPAARAQVRPVRPVHRVQRLSRVPLRQEGGEEDRRRLPEVRWGDGPKRGRRQVHRLRDYRGGRAGVRSGGVVSSVADEVARLRGTKSSTFRDLLTHPPFARLMAAQTVSSLGDWIGFIAVAALVKRLGGNVGAYAVAGVMMARMLPSILFGPLAGALVDRFDRKRIMIVADLSRAGLYASMPFLGSIWLIFLFSFVIESLSLLWTPARDASLPNLVPRRQLANANSLSLVTTYGALPFSASIFALVAGISSL